MTPVSIQTVPGHTLRNVNFQSLQPNQEVAIEPRLQQLAAQHPVLKRMLDMVLIPSATAYQVPAQHLPEVERQLGRMRDYVVQSVKAMGYHQIEQNKHGSLIIRIPGSRGYEHLRPLMLTAHMDIVAGDPNHPTRQVRPRIVKIGNQEWLASDGTTTLGADDKGGLAMILENLARLKNRPHAPLEILLSPDEEGSLESLKKLNTRQFKAEHVLVVDDFEVFQGCLALGSTATIDLKIKGIRGGHSGDDIAKPNRLNAIMLMTELVQKLGNGIVQMHPRYPKIPMLSKNLGLIQGGSASNAIPETASATYCLRAHDSKLENAHIERMKHVAKTMELAYRKQQPGLKIQVNIDDTERFPAWEANPHSILPKLLQDGARRYAQQQKLPQTPDVKMKPFHARLKDIPKVKYIASHAAAQASILANQKNADGQAFDAQLIGPRIKEAHTTRERLNIETLIQADLWLGHIIDAYTQHATQEASKKP